MRLIFYKFIVVLLFFSQTLLSIETLFLLEGPPGSGKGTLSQYMKAHYGYHHVSIGDVLRKEIELGTELGKQVEALVRNGDNIDSTILCSLLTKILEQNKEVQGPLILDGFGRTKEDMWEIKKLLVNNVETGRIFMVLLEAPDAVCQERILKRAVCSDCGEVYNEVSRPPEKAMECDLCKSPLKIRFNDTPEVIRKRLENYRNSVEPSYQMAAAELFPTIFFETDKSLEECAIFYDALAANIIEWKEGDLPWGCNFFR